MGQGATLRLLALVLLALLRIPPRGVEAMRVATCLAGQVRTLGQTYKSLAENWASRFPQGEGVQARDLFIYLDTNCNPWKCPLDELDQWINTLDPVASELYNRTYKDWKDVVPESHCDIPSRDKSTDAGFWHQHEKLRRCYALVTAHERKMGWKYDYVARLRPDFFIHSMSIKTTDLDPEHILSYDECRPVGEFASGPLCDMLFVVPRQWSDVVFSAVNAWTTCRTKNPGNDNRAPCHVPSWNAAGGTPGECLLTGWLVDNHIDPAVFKRIERTVLDGSLLKVSISQPPASASAAPVAPQPAQHHSQVQRRTPSPNLTPRQRAVKLLVHQKRATTGLAAAGAAGSCANVSSSTEQEAKTHVEIEEREIARDREYLRKASAELSRQQNAMKKWQEALWAEKDAIDQMMKAATSAAPEASPPR